MPKKKPKTPEELYQEKLKVLHHTINSGWSNVNLRHIHTWKELLAYIGAGESEVKLEELNERPTYERYKEITTRLLRRFSEDNQPIDIGESGYYITQFRDSLIESDYQEEVKDVETFPTHQEVVKPKRVTIHELVAPYWPPDNPAQVCETFYFQAEWAKWAFYKFTIERARARMCRANVGDGKTFALGELVRRLYDSGWFEGKTFSPYPVVYVTKASIVTQTERVLSGCFGLDTSGTQILVTNYDALRSTFGEQFIEEVEHIEEGIHYRDFKWKPFFFPAMIIWDECHSLKNAGSQQSRIAQAYNEIPEEWPMAKHTLQVFSSASPFSKVAQAKCFAVACRPEFSSGFGARELTNKSFDRFAAAIASPADPQEYSKPAMKRFLKVMSPWIGGFRNVRRKHHGRTVAKVVGFETVAKRQQYELAWERYQEEKRRIEGNSAITNARFQELVALMVFQQAAEIIKADLIAYQCYESWKKGLAPAGGFKFKPTIAKIVGILNAKYNIPRSKISLIWGGTGIGGKTYEKQEMKDILLKAARGEEVTKATLNNILRQLKYESSGLADLPADLDLGIQSKEARQREIDRFQDGKSEFCFYTFGAGGAGLSLHHAYEHTRQRQGHFAVTWNEMDMYQATGRLPRLTSLSDTLQCIWAYAGTIEVGILQKLNLKTGCLNEVISHSEMTESVVKEEEVDSVLRISGSKYGDNDDEEEEDKAVFEEYEQETIDEQPVLDI